MTDPTRAEVGISRFDPCPFGGAMTLDPSGDYVRHDDYAALRERAEAAERVIKAQDYDYGRAISERDAARRAEVAAWNDAIEAAEAAYAHGFAAIRALRRAAPTEGAMRMETGMEHIARDIREGRFPERSEPRMRPAAPTEGEA